MSSPPRPAGAERPAAPKRWLNELLHNATGYQLRRVRRPSPVDSQRADAHIERMPEPTTRESLVARQARVHPVDRLLETPGFVLSSVRSGSTLLRLVLDTHPQICAPHELHLRRINATMSGSARYAMEQVGTDDLDLRNLLWDRVLHRELVRSGKTRLVNKTPNDALIWAQLAACWPDARFIYLYRHPGAILDSWERARGPGVSRELLAEDIFAYAAGMAQAQAVCGGLVVRYEELTADPEAQTRRICEFLGVGWDERMIAYGSTKHLGMRRGLGDWSERMRSGVIHAARETPDTAELPERLRPVAQAWGYLPAAGATVEQAGPEPGTGPTGGDPAADGSRTAGDDRPSEQPPWFYPDEEAARR